MPDVFVPMDTTTTTLFYRQCSRKATSMRFAAAMFDKYGSRLASIDSFAAMDKFLAQENIARQFVRFAMEKDKIKCTEAEWAASRSYMEPEVFALVARYSALSENAFYKYYLPIDSTVDVALENL